MNMLSSGRRVLQDLLLQPAVRSFSLSPVQSTIIVERWWEVPLSKVGSPPRLHPRRHRVYKLVEDTKNRPKEKMELILTQTVPKLGGRGDTVFVKKAMGRNKLLAEGLAVYPSPENKQIFAEELRTVEFLKSSHLKINRMPVDEFHVNKEILCRQFLKRLDVVVPPHALSFPFETVKDVGDYWCEVQVNGIDTVRVPVSVLPYEDPSAAYQRQLKAKKQQQEAENISEPSDETEATVRAVVSDATVEAEAKPDEDSVREVSEASAPAGASASEKTAASAEPSDDKTAPPSDSPKKD
ncbi:S ribosomal protein L9%2C mitochondrial [Xyrichtys novacula]|uniref:Large ribosomal subunit protein bL9m n=1 Tax=Xyrichtys novacula TaxID=13765 RepID=A0AAV1HF30_XYRNO|nr:S ribosomal protein L9%2C mitochondrial [Xyrichtys novacula]